MELKDEVIELIAGTLEVGKDEIKDGKTLYDSVGVDSTEMVELIITINKHFDIKVEATDITKTSTPEDIVNIIKTKKLEVRS